MEYLYAVLGRRMFCRRFLFCPKSLKRNADKFDPREYLKPARAAIKELVSHKIVDVLGCDHKA